MADYRIPDDCLYTREDEWVRAEGDDWRIGVTDYAQQQLGDVVFVELPEPGTDVKRGETFGVVESVKAVSDLYSPVSGAVTEINGELAERPEIVNEDCYGGGWMLSVSGVDSADLEGLMDAEAYGAYVASREE